MRDCDLPRTRFHDLRHTAATLAWQSGYGLREVMVHLGHSTPKMALRYQHAADERMCLLAKNPGQMIPTEAPSTGTDNVVSIRPDLQTDVAGTAGGPI